MAKTLLNPPNQFIQQQQTARSRPVSTPLPIPYRDPELEPSRTPPPSPPTATTMATTTTTSTTHNPTRKNNMFGPYLLLQTLGEGEFGKVKLGMHVDSHEEVLRFELTCWDPTSTLQILLLVVLLLIPDELSYILCLQVAVKLIRKESVESQSRMQKIQREIGVLQVNYECALICCQIVCLI